LLDKFGAKKNLDVSNWRNGEAIPKVTTDEEWESAGENEEPTWCYYDNEPANGTKYRNPQAVF